VQHLLKWVFCLFVVQVESSYFVSKEVSEVVDLGLCLLHPCSGLILKFVDFCAQLLVLSHHQFLEVRASLCILRDNKACLFSAFSRSTAREVSEVKGLLSENLLAEFLVIYS
jgi:hypothetical protein